MHVIFDRLFGGLRLLLQARAEHHLGRDQKQQQPTGDFKRGRGDTTTVEQGVADERRAEQHRARDQTGALRDLPLRLRRQPGREPGEHRRKPDRVDHNQQGDERGNEIVERHPVGVARPRSCRPRRLKITA